MVGVSWFTNKRTAGGLQTPSGTIWTLSPRYNVCGCRQRSPPHGKKNHQGFKISLKSICRFVFHSAARGRNGPAVQRAFFCRDEVDWTFYAHISKKSVYITRHLRKGLLFFYLGLKKKNKKPKKTKRWFPSFITFQSR